LGLVEDDARPFDPRRHRRHCRAHLDGHAMRLVRGLHVPEPIHVVQRKCRHRQGGARTDDDAGRLGIDADDIKRRRIAADVQPAALADGKIDDPVMAAEDAAVEVDDIAGLDRAGTEPGDQRRIVPGRHEADVLAVGLVRHRQGETRRQGTCFRLGHLAEGKAQEIELVAGRREQEIALVAAGVDGAVKLGPRRADDAANVMPGRQRDGTERSRGIQ